MKTSDFRNNPTSSQLKENMNKMFGVNVNFNKYSREQLEDMRNKLRTRVFQQEGKAGINDLLTNETYQKDKAMLALLNTRIKEMLGENLKQLKDKMIELSEAKKGVRAPKFTKKAAGAKPDFLDMDKDGDKKEPMKKAVADKKVKEGFPTVDDAKKAAAGTAGMKQGEKKKSSTGGEITKTATGLKHTAGKNYGGQDAPKAPDSDKKAKKTKESIAQEGKKTKAADKKVKEAPNEGNAFGKAVRAAKADGVQAGEKVKVGGKTYPVKESVWKTQITKESMDIYKRHVKIVNESLGYLINEDEEGKAKAITAAGDMVNDFTSWMQRVGQYQTKTMIELADAIKADFGAAEAEAFKQAVGPALSATLETLTQQREAVSGAVAVLAGEATPDAAMGMEPGMDAGMPPEAGMDMAPPDEMNPPADEFGASDAAAGMGTTGREMRESKFARKLAESHSILSKLAK